MPNVVISVKPGEIIRAEYLTRVCKEYNGYLGTAAVIDGKLTIDHFNAAPTPEAIMDVQTALKDNYRVFCLGKSMKDMLPTDMMPFEIILDKASDTRAALFLDGNFHGYGKAKGKGVQEFFCKEEFLEAFLAKIYKSSGGTVEHFIAELQDPITQSALQNTWTDRGLITILTASGPPITIMNEKNAYFAQYNWGNTSQSLNYVEKTEPKLEDKPKELSPLEKLKLKMKASGGSPPAETVPVEPPKTDTAIPTADPNDLEWVGPAPSFHEDGKPFTNAHKKDWWTKQVGYIPEGYKTPNCKVQRKKGTNVGVFAPLLHGQVLPTVTPAVTSPDTVEPMKVDPKTLPDTTPAVEEPSSKDVAPHHISMDNIMHMSPRSKLKLKNHWLSDAEVIKTLGDDMRQKAFDPKTLKNLEDNYATFADGLGLNPDTLWLSMESLVKLGTIDLQALAQYAFNRQADWARTRNELLGALTDPNRRVVLTNQGQLAL